jgi:hypothetical protein
MKTKLLLSIVLGFAFFSCKKENCFDCIKSTGKIITQERSLNSFKSVFVEDKKCIPKIDHGFGIVH